MNSAVRSPFGSGGRADNSTRRREVVVAQREVALDRDLTAGGFEAFRDVVVECGDEGRMARNPLATHCSERAVDDVADRLIDLAPG